MNYYIAVTSCLVSLHAKWNWNLETEFSPEKKKTRFNSQCIKLSLLRRGWFPDSNLWLVTFDGTMEGTCHRTKVYPLKVDLKHIEKNFIGKSEVLYFGIHWIGITNWILYCVWSGVFVTFLCYYELFKLTIVHIRFECIRKWTSWLIFIAISLDSKKCFVFREEKRHLKAPLSWTKIKRTP